MSDLRTYLSETAQRELDSLRAALDNRLMALEKALAHPDPTESLESLIIDLARVASDEAHASAARRWLEAQASAEAQAPAGRHDGGAGIHGALIEESAALRREAEELRGRLQRETDRGDSLRRDNEAAQTTLSDERAARGRLDAELERLRTANADLTEAVETLRGDLDAARKRLVDATTQANTGAREAESGRAAAAALQAQFADLERTLAGEREERRRDAAAAEARTAEAISRADTAEAALAAERARAREAEESLAAETTKARELESRARDLEASVAGENARVREAEHALETLREANAKLSDDLRAAAERVRLLEAELSAQAEKGRADLSAAAEQLRIAKVEVERLQSERTSVMAELDEARSARDSSKTVFDAARQEAVTALAAATARVRELELQLFRREQASAESQDLDLGAMLEERAPAGEHPIRRFSRYSFRSQMAVDIEGLPAQLVDLSVGGAQVVSEQALELHREAAVELVSDEIPVSGRAKVMWTRADPQSKGRALRYRAGIQFLEVDPAAVEAYIIRYSST